jgi:peptidoglycan/LPS O-acetylase OafA/YrhL
MHRLPRVIALALLLAVTVISPSAFAAPLPAHTTPGALSAAWEPLTRLWDWLSGQVNLQGLVPAPRAGRRSLPKGAARPAGTLSPAARTDEGAAPDPYGSSAAQTDEGAAADPNGG